MKKSKLIKTILGISCISLGALLASCGESESTKYTKYQLATPGKTEYVYSSKMDKDALDKFKQFNGKLSNLLYQNHDDSNYCISPVSIYMALSMLEACTNDKDCKEIEDYMNIDKETNKKLLKDIYGHIANSKGSEITNSLWLSNEHKYKEEAINDLANNYCAYPFSVNWKEDESLGLVHDFIYNHTHKLIDYTPNSDSLRTIMLINTLYFKDSWTLDGTDLNFTKDTYDFINYDNSIKNEKFLSGHYSMGKVYTNEMYSTFYTKTAHDFSIQFVMPNDGYTVDDLFKDNIIYDAITTKYTYSTETADYYTKVLFPSFSIDYKEEIADILKTDGLTFLKEPTKFTKLISDDEDVVVNSIKHITKLEVNEKGATGAAATLVDVSDTGVEPREKINETFIVNKACAFIINHSGIPLFIGALKNI